ncbi:MAG: acyl-CoA dehydrogenase [Dehalococcoidia bacterium]|nr:MAG: acyl-CoA dehydrogenase [Dehalococcoidia bacterium]
MDFGFTEKEKTLRRELQEFAKAELPPDWVIGGYAEEYCTDYKWQVTQQISKKLAERGWLTMAWPKEYGGLDATHTEYLLYREEATYNMLPGTDMGVGGVSWIGQSLILFGTEEQKKKHLPGIAAGETYWCTGYSETEAGSDLASLKLRAVKKGDEYIISGQKVWTSAAHRCSWCWLAVRTDPDAPKHKGISLFLVDLKTPGVTVKPLMNLAGLAENSEVFYDDAHVPADCLVGEENQGWRCIMTALAFERTAGAEHLGRSRRMVDDFVKYARETKRNGKPLSKDPLVRHKLAEFAIECEVGRLMCYSIAWMEDRGLIPGHESSMAKNFCSELGQRLSNAGLGIMGLYGQLGASLNAPIGGMAQTAYLFGVGDTLGGGTSEINRTIIATRGLGLPRG